MNMARKIGSHADITGPAIREAALRLFAQSGYAAVSMRQIAAEVGVRAGALYLYTPDKQTLLFDLMCDHLDTLMDAWQTAKGGNTPLERLETLVRFHVDYHIDRRDAVFLAYMELRNLTDENFSEVEKRRARYEAEVQSILADGQKSGDFQLDDVRVTTMALIAMLTGVNTWFSERGRLSREDVQAIYLNLTRRMVQA